LIPIFVPKKIKKFSFFLGDKKNGTFWKKKFKKFSQFFFKKSKMELFELLELFELFIFPY